MERQITVNWGGKMHFEASGPNESKIVMDTLKDYGGDEQGLTPKMLLLVSLAGCTGMDVISMLKKMRQDVTGYRLEVKGWDREEHPKKFERIVVEHIVEGHNISQEAVAKAVKLSHEKYCTVSAALSGSVEIEMVGRAVEVPAE